MSTGYIRIGIKATATDLDIKALCEYLKDSKKPIIKNVVEDVGAFR